MNARTARTWCARLLVALAALALTSCLDEQTMKTLIELAEERKRKDDAPRPVTPAAPTQPVRPAVLPNPITPPRVAGGDAHEPDNSYPHTRPGLQLNVWQEHTIAPAGDIDHIAWVPLPRGRYHVDCEASGAKLRAYASTVEMQATMANLCRTDKLLRVVARARNQRQDIILKPKQSVPAPRGDYSVQIYEPGSQPRLVTSWPNANSGFYLHDARGKVILSTVAPLMTQTRGYVLDRNDPLAVNVLDTHPILLITVKAHDATGTGTYRLRLRR